MKTATKAEVNQRYEEFINRIIANDGRCMWQITGAELAKIGYPNMKTLECWQTPAGFIIMQKWPRDGFTYYLETKKHDMSECAAELGLIKPAGAA